MWAHYTHYRHHYIHYNIHTIDHQYTQHRTSNGPDIILLKCAVEPALKLLFSQSLDHGFIPASLKRAAITPVFKSGPKTSPSNYRPISLTSTISKVFERIVRKQVVGFFTRKGHLNNTPHCF